MAVETLTIPLDGDIDGDDFFTGDADDNQIVTFTDGGDLSGTITIQKFGKGDPTEPGAGPGGDDRFIFDLSQFDDDFNVEFKSVDAGDVVEVSGWDTRTIDGTIYTYTYTGTDGQPHTVSIDMASQNGDAADVTQTVCFAAGTKITTRDGKKPIELLTPDDWVLCDDAVYRRIKWVGSNVFSRVEGLLDSPLPSVRFAPNSIAQNVPDTTTYLSLQHAVALAGPMAELLFGMPKVLARAKDLVNETTIILDTSKHQITYFHILLDGHHVIYANEMPAESLHVSHLTNRVVGALARSEICVELPSLAGNLASAGDTSLMVLKPHESLLMASLTTRKNNPLAGQSLSESDA